MALPKLLQSSQDTEKISLFLKSLPTTIVLVGSFFGMDFDLAGVNEVVDVTAKGVVGLLASISSAYTLWGLIRKRLPKNKDFNDLGK